MADESPVSLRLGLLRPRVDAAAKAAGVGVSEWIRRAIVVELGDSDVRSLGADGDRYLFEFTQEVRVRLGELFDPYEDLAALILDELRRNGGESAVEGRPGCEKHGTAPGRVCIPCIRERRP